jgi:phenylalanyl-tRNA synthetase beta chain
MKVSYAWLSEYVENLPPVEQVVDALTMHSFEIESVEDAKKDDNNGDKILDVKILPNRAHDCLSHYGIASEIASVCELTRKPLLEPIVVQKNGKIKISIDTKLCSRVVAIHITGLKIGESPDWLKEKLALMGQRPINSIVDITNYLMYAFGQPTHAFDAGKIQIDWLGNLALQVRVARKGEKITLLNKKEYELDPTMMVIADKDRALDVAGVMGGADTGVTADGEHPTREIILTLCNFDAVSIRKTSKVLGVQTDASKRFENDISPALIDRVLPYALKLISEISGGDIVATVDEYPNTQKQTLITTTAEKISAILGVELDAEKIIGLLARQQISAEIKKMKKGDEIIVAVPLERLDLTLSEDIAEEVGRLYGYEHIAPAQLPTSATREINPIHYVTNKTRMVLRDLGFSEIYTYAFVGEGEVEVENPLASDKKFLRQDLATAMSASLEHNFKFLDLLGLKEVKLFEIGKIFKKQGEFLHLSLGVKYPKGTKSHVMDEEIVKAIRTIESVFGVSIGDVSVVGGQAEIDLDRILDEVKIPEIYPEEFWRLTVPNVSYKIISPYPFAVRDVAVFVPSEKSVDDVKQLISQHFTPLVVRCSLFDTFVKGEKTSYAFRLVFQSAEKTLTDEDINAVMNPIYETLKVQEGFEIR